MKLHIAIPVMQELLWLPKTLDCIAQQIDSKCFHVYICINQPNEWWNLPEKIHVCYENHSILQMLNNEQRFPLSVIDCSSQGKGWTKKKNGVGYARKTLFDYIMKYADNKDIIISLDADTTFGKHYFSIVYNTIKQFPKHSGLISQYYHKLTGDEIIDRAMLRYEIYLRCYMLNLCKAGSPYNFTALGSAMAMPVAALKAVGGITPFSSGEDFYMAQKLRKYAPLILSSQALVFPSARLSERVPFGTGPALIKGVKKYWDAYPIYAPEDFKPLQQTFSLFPALFKADIRTPVDAFLQSKFGNQNIWQPLRNNFKNEHHFINACHQKIDGLKTLQWLHSLELKTDDNENLVKNIQYHCHFMLSNFDFSTTSIFTLNAIRNALFLEERNFRLNSIKQ